MLDMDLSKIQIFRVFFRKSDSICLNGIFYLPSIDKTPAEISAVYEILLQVKTKTEALSYKETDLVRDHTIYCKALLILIESLTVQCSGFPQQTLFLTSRRFYYQITISTDFYYKIDSLLLFNTTQ